MGKILPREHNLTYSSMLGIVQLAFFPQFVHQIKEISMNVRVHEELTKVKDEWIRSGGFFDRTKTMSSVADEQFDLIRVLILDPHTEVSEKQWQIIKEALLCGLFTRSCRNESDSKLHVYSLAFAIAGFINSNTVA